MADLHRVVDWNPRTRESDDLIEIAHIAGVPRRRLARAQQRIRQEQYGGERVAQAWTMEPRQQTTWAAFRHYGILRQFAVYVGAYAFEYAFILASWWLIGSWAFEGAADPSVPIAWALILMTMVPLQFVSRWLEGSMSIRIGILVKRTLMRGALNLDPDLLNADGPSSLVARVLESNRLESSALTGAFVAVVATIELLFAGTILAAGAAGFWLASLLACWLVILAGGYWILYRQADDWTVHRLRATHTLAENMIGNRTRVAQQHPNDWNVEDDEALSSYYQSSRKVDRTMTILELLSSRCWLLSSVLLLVPFVLMGVSSVKLAIAVAGMLAADRALTRSVPAARSLVNAVIAWERMAPLYRSSRTAETPGSPRVVASLASHRADHFELELYDVSFKYPSRPDAVLSAASLTIRSGDRILLEGRSGGGKSTLAALLGGLRTPSSGLVLMQGFDYGTIGRALWGSLVVVAPQFHQNHIIAESCALKVLFGRRLPPSAEDLAMARNICSELGLDDLLERMPGGIFQFVGDTGWQLSHGERSRLFVARALLHGAEMIILDESFGALDPETFQLVVGCVERRARTLVLIAHP
jgi:ATP-binding cassette subfamily B protein